MKMLAPELLLFVLFLTSSYEIGVSHILEGASGQRPWNEKPGNIISLIYFKELNTSLTGKLVDVY